MFLVLFYRTLSVHLQDISEGLPQDVCQICHLALHIGPYRDKLRTSAGNIFRLSAGDAPWCYLQDHTGTFSGRYIVTSVGEILPWPYIEDHSGRSPQRNFAEQEKAFANIKHFNNKAYVSFIDITDFFSECISEYPYFYNFG